MLGSPRDRLPCPLLIRDPPDIADAVRVEVRGDRKLAHGRSESIARMAP